MGNGWIRFCISRWRWPIAFRSSVWIDSGHTWLAQAYCIFKKLRESTSTDHHAWPVLVNQLQYEVTVTPEFSWKYPIPYLFIRCVDGAIDLGSESEWLYWSLDSEGVGKISPEDRSFTLPSIELDVRAYTRYLRSFHYDAIRKIHIAKGYDPNAQDVARHLGLPLYELTEPPETEQMQDWNLTMYINPIKDRIPELVDEWYPGEERDLIRAPLIPSLTGFETPEMLIKRDWGEESDPIRAGLPPNLPDWPKELFDPSDSAIGVAS